jgi:hypothetical protein
MSSIRATTISDLAGTGPATLTKQSAAKAWISVNQTGTPAIRNSFNVSSITDLSVGETVVTYSSAMASANFAVVVSGNPYNFGGSTGGAQSAGNGRAGGTKTASRHTIDLRNNPNVNTDNDDAASAVLGDLA